MQKVNFWLRHQKSWWLSSSINKIIKKILCNCYWTHLKMNTWANDTLKFIKLSGLMQIIFECMEQFQVQPLRHLEREFVYFTSHPHFWSSISPGNIRFIGGEGWLSVHDFNLWWALLKKFEKERKRKMIYWSSDDNVRIAINHHHS